MFIKVEQEFADSVGRMSAGDRKSQIEVVDGGSGIAQYGTLECDPGNWCAGVAHYHQTAKHIRHQE